MILVTGATGNLGKAVVTQLLKKTAASNIAILARDAHKTIDLKKVGVEIRISDFDNPSSLLKALKGIDQVLLISGTDPINRFLQHKNVVDAALKNGIKRIAYTSIAMNDFSTSANQFLMQSHFQTEDYIQASQVNYTFYRNNLYADTILMFAGENPFETGISLPTGHGKVGFALRREIGEAIANDLVICESGNRIYQMTGSQSYSYSDIAFELSKISGSDVFYNDLKANEYKEILKKYEIPEEYIQMYSAFTEDIISDQHDIVSSDLEKLLARKPIQFSDALKELYNLK